MALMTAYLLKTSSLGEFFNAIQAAKAPERFSQKFLKDLDFTTSNDRLYVGVLKGLNFIDENGVPQQTYFEFLDQTNAGRVLAGAIENAYSDLFNLKKDAQKMDLKEVKGKFKSLTQGQKSENVINNMAVTFLALCERADWSKPKKAVIPQVKKVADIGKPETITIKPNEEEKIPSESIEGIQEKLSLHYNIQLILPNSRD